MLGSSAPGRTVSYMLAATLLVGVSCSSGDEGDGSGAAGPGGASSTTATSGSGGATASATSSATGPASSSSGQGGSAGGGSGDTWGNYAQGFFAMYCVECHGAGNTMRDYTTIADVQVDHAEIACGVATTKLSGCADFPPPAQFPIDNATKDNPKPSDAERARLVAWIEAGLPE